MVGFITLQGKIAGTGVAQQLPSNPLHFKSVTIAAKTGNTAAIVITPSSTGGATDGTGTGHILAAGTSVTILGLVDTNSIWLTGTLNDVYSLIGS